MSTSTDFSTLGRLGTADSGSTRTPSRRKVRAADEPRAATRRRRRRSRPSTPPTVLPLWMSVAAVAGGLLVLLFVIGTVIDGQTRTGTGVTVADPTIEPELLATLRGDTAITAVDDTEVDNAGVDNTVALVPGGGLPGEPAVGTPTFAATGNLALTLPLPGAAEVIFTEADTATALPLVPVGRMTVNDNPEGFGSPEVFDGPDYSVAGPVSGIRPATGLVVVLAAPQTPVLAPTSGVIETVTPQSTTATADGSDVWQVAIRAQGSSDLFVVVGGIAAPAVQVGQEVQGGSTTLGALGTDTRTAGEGNLLALPAATVHVRPAVAEIGITPSRDGSDVSDDLTG